MILPCNAELALYHGRPPRADHSARLFPDLPHWAGLGSEARTLGALRHLAGSMIAPPEAGAADDNPDIPAGYTYLAQFVDHDLTFDPWDRDELPEVAQSSGPCRPPALNLDCVYGLGPEVQPRLYQGEDRDKLRIGRTSTTPGCGDPSIPVGLPHDLPHDGGPPPAAVVPGVRMARAGAIADPRNGENLVLAQTHLAFLRFHNAVVDHLRAGCRTVASVFAEARQIVTWHYQWIVINDFLRRLADPAVFARFGPPGSPHSLAARRTTIPDEFSAAAYRIGHAMVRDAYDVNRVYCKGGGAVPLPMRMLFRFAGPDGDPAPIPSDWIVDWRRFYEFGGDVAPNPSRRIGPRLTASLQWAHRDGSLPELDLRHGYRRRLPPGQDVAAALGLPALPAELIATGPDGEAAARHGMHLSTPLGYYVLKEAQMLGGPSRDGSVDGGRRLGPVGSWIVCSTLFGLVDGDPASYRRAAGSWTPTLSGRRDGEFGMADLLAFAGDINPIGDACTGANTVLATRQGASEAQDVTL